ncbi:S-adenosyl-L-methionine-dependent methyltransferase [Aspergillus pseudonomiae]|uniref:S-adenosyl-L-methionine-dependent methyltransferase n=1 Tax=Aspergillus pseudonomiae TaxID=1506151 RepID=A0A5N7DVF2_9EURO|nr:S-adenosyl-L-methionine-dependent methyltransferase [Aspergillus pseudonomiae]KAB8261299.1 S-adenosyl-L-methionine-dependent methyltransferase [Aspergillus pseudonomiae]KAE8410033.1 S-adenosyl-L-methionine-dependent methyltransferase [Aspergillus pseudonomiae]
MDVPQQTDWYLQSITAALKRLNAAANECQERLLTHHDGSIKGISANQIAHDNLVMEASKFLQTAQGPIDTVATCFERTAHLACARSLLEMGVFEALPTGKESRGTRNLAEELKVDETLLARLMRNSALFEETGPGQYRHTPSSEAYLKPEIRGMFRFAMDEHMPAHIKMHEFLKRNSWREPTSTSNNPYTYAHDTNGKSMWEYLSERPTRMASFNVGMTFQAMTELWMIDLFPWESLSSLDPTPTTVVVVDIGGGTGKGISRIWSHCGDLAGRFILQDQAHVIQAAGSLGDRIEKMACDFSQDQPVRGALTYLIRRCLHNWPQESIVEILRNVAAAMRPEKSRLLIEEIIVPDTNPGTEEAWMDMIMMNLGAKQRTLKEWNEVLDSAGLKLKEVYQIPGNCHGLLEAWIK